MISSSYVADCEYSSSVSESSDEEVEHVDKSIFNFLWWSSLRTFIHADSFSVSLDLAVSLIFFLVLAIAFVFYEVMGRSVFDSLWCLDLI